MDLEEFNTRRSWIESKESTILEEMNQIPKESGRVSQIANNSRVILHDLEREFESQTGLRGADIGMLFLGVGLQCARIFLVNKLTHIEKAGFGNKNEDFLHDLQAKILNRFNVENGGASSIEYASLEHIITARGVPYDATGYANESLGLFKGANHRFSTLGHDPILGLIFGTANILTNTITCIHTPVITTNHVVYDANMKNPRIAGFTSTVEVLRKSYVRMDSEISAIVAALIKQIIHIGTDLYTPCGIQIPGANLVLSNQNVEKMTKYISFGDVLKVGTSAKIAEFINLIISTVHMLLYNEKKHGAQELYQLRTRKIIIYSNTIATISNVVWTAGNVAMGNEVAIKDLDWGGLIKLINRLLTDQNFAREIKGEFVYGNFKKMIESEF